MQLIKSRVSVGNHMARVGFKIRANPHNAYVLSNLIVLLAIPPDGTYLLSLLIAILGNDTCAHLLQLGSRRRKVQNVPQGWKLGRNEAYHFVVPGRFESGTGFGDSSPISSVGNLGEGAKVSHLGAVWLFSSDLERSRCRSIGKQGS